MIQEIANDIRSELAARSSEKDRESAQRFFKEKIKAHGLKSGAVKAVAKSFYQSSIKSMAKDDVLELCENLWQSGYIEETFVACYFTERLSKKFTESDFLTFERWVKVYIDNWASCDTFCNHTIGDMLMKYPHLIERVKQWTKSNNRWERRAAAVSLIVPTKKGMFHDDIVDIATMLLTDSDDMVQKGYGWLLKVTSQVDLKLVFNFVMRNKNKMPRTALRYAIEKMPQELKAKAMAK